MIGVCFIRNLFATIVAVTITYWIEGMGLVGMHVLTAVVAFVTAASTFPMQYFGKRARRWTQKRLDKIIARQSGQRN